MNMVKNLKKVGLALADLVFPVSCVVCSKEGSFLCNDCKGKLPRLEKQICVVCKKAAPYGKTHPDCVTRNTVDGIISALSYNPADTKKLIGTFKYEFIYDLAAPLSQMIVEAIKNQDLEGYFSEFIIIPVALHKRRFNWRGFNQAELLAESLGRDLDIQVDKQLVTRSKYTQPQIKLKADQRRTNIENAFSLNKEVTGKFLIVDDVVTTGSTLNEISKLLKKNGAQEVWATTIAHG